MDPRAKALSWAIALLLFAAVSVDSQTAAACTVEDLIAQRSPQSGGLLLTEFLEDCNSNTSAKATTINTAWLIRSAPSAKANIVWDTQFTVAEFAAGPGVNVTITQLALANVQLSYSRFLQPKLLVMDSTAQLGMKDVSISTDCNTVAVYQNWSSSLMPASQVVSGAGYLYINQYVSRNLTADSVNITCTIPPIRVYNDTYWNYIADDGLSFLNAIAAAQFFNTSRADPWVFVQRNVSISQSYWKNTVVLNRNMTIYGIGQQDTVIDWQAQTSLLQVGPGIFLTFRNLWMMNLSPLHGAVIKHMGMLPLFTIPFWVVRYSGDNRSSNQVLLNNITWTPPQSEYQYITYWSAVVTTTVPGLAAAAALLKTGFSNITLGHYSTTTHINFELLKGSGIDGKNLTFAADPPAAFPWILNNTILPAFRLDPTPNLNLDTVGCYNLYDFNTVMQQLQDSPNDRMFIVALFNDISLSDAYPSWPAAGYNISNDLVIVGKSADNFTTLDLALKPRLLNMAWNTTAYLVYLNLMNLPTQQQAGAAAGLDDAQATLTLPFVSIDPKRSPRPTFLNNALSLTVPYAEYTALKQAVNSQGSVPDLSSYKVTSTSSDSITFSSLNYTTWVGTNIVVTYSSPPDTNFRLLYNNQLEPPPVSNDSSSKLVGGAIAGIVIGAVVGAAIMGLIAFFVVRRSTCRDAPQSMSEKNASMEQEDRAAKVSSTGANGQQSKQSSQRQPEFPSEGHSAAVDAATVKLKLSDDSSATQNSSNPKQRSGAQPLDELNSVLQSLTADIDDKHLVILDVLGTGGFAVVYKGMWKGLVVAVKTITFQDRLYGGEKSQHTAIMEAAISSSLAHPNVVTTYSYDLKPLRVHGDHMDSSSNFRISEQAVTDWKLYIIQEYCDAGSLRQAVLKRKFWDEQLLQPRMDFILECALELASGLAHLHSKNIIHGDLNPNNVLLKRDPGNKRGFVCKIADFGLSIKMAVGQSHISNMRRGTPFYTSPEVMAHGNMTKAADTFAFGVMLWEMFHSMMCYKSQPNNSFLARDIFPSFPKRCPVDYAALAMSCMGTADQRPPFTDIVAWLKKMMQDLQQGTLVYGEPPLQRPC